MTRIFGVFGINNTDKLKNSTWR